MKHIEYKTGRNYGADQVLKISLVPATDYISASYFDRLIAVSFEDEVRGIAGTVELYGFETCESDSSIGAAVLREYDAGRYIGYFGRLTLNQGA